MTEDEALQSIIDEIRADAAKHPRVERRSRHRDCCRYTYDPVGRRWPQVGEVRRCEHGKVQIALAAPSYSGNLMPAGWRDISRFWRPRLYRKALELLEKEG